MLDTVIKSSDEAAAPVAEVSTGCSETSRSLQLTLKVENKSNVTVHLCDPALWPRVLTEQHRGCNQGFC